MALSRRLGAYVRVLCALALFAVGFAHQPPVIRQAAFTSAELALYTLPDGTLPDFCLTGKDGEGNHHGVFGSDCEACRISATIALPCPSDMGGDVVRREFARLRPPEDVPPARYILPPNAKPRAPPALSSMA